MTDENPPILEDSLLFRDELTKRVRLELLGPTQEDSEEDKKYPLKARPTDIFSCGVIYPENFVPAMGNVEEASEVPLEEISAEGVDVLEQDDSVSEQQDTQDQGREEVELTFDDGDIPNDIFSEQQRVQSSFGLSFVSKITAQLAISVNFATYSAEKIEFNGREQVVYKRQQHSFSSKVSVDIAARSGQQTLGDSQIEITFLKRENLGGQAQITFWIRNKKPILSASEIWKNCIFQPEMSIRSDLDFIGLGSNHNNGLDADTRSYSLLYRDSKSFCRGHGCAGFWSVGKDGGCREISSEFFPVHEIMPILPTGEGERFSGIDFSFSANSNLAKGLGDASTNSFIVSNALKLCDAYETWIEIAKQKADGLDSKLRSIGFEHLQKCDEALSRMRSGVGRLESDDYLLRAFRLANHGMWLQQLHGALPSRYLDDEFIEPDLLQESALARSWRPFQLAFILMNLDGLPIGPADGINQKNSELVDLIWFPTGGGKTEAYLGVAAIAMCFSRLLEPSSSGTEVLMRYTLRLLTSQQFQRATFLVLALENMRRNGLFEEERIQASSNEFSAGLWVGRELTPNKTRDAHRYLSQMRNDGKKNKFAILECPWCKTSLEKRKQDGPHEYDGYISFNSKQFNFCCIEKRCAFSGGVNQHLPIYVIDEQLYEKLPSLVLSTVDKFALLPWNDGPQNFLGKKTGRPPSLVIQDELHLISGPLGSVVGHYEDLIFGIMKSVAPDRTTKIIASTATIRRAVEQVDGLYNRSVSTFPPQGLDYKDSFFAKEAKKGEEVNGKPVFGRRYVGVFAAVDKSHITSQVKLLSALIQLPMGYVEGFLPEKDEKNFADGMDKRKLPESLPNSFKGMNPFGTLVWYFNSKRELSYADSLLSQDIEERIKGLCRRYDIPFGLRRRAVNKQELTSRTKEFEIFEILKQLDISWNPARNCRAIDVLLATSMISVGVDINRLGLMVVTGQPKNTSEYIQASSRVGRQEPGLVFTLYNQNRARDRSHFETFLGYHQSIYRFVEPTSVTPYSYKCRERALPGLLIGVARHILDIGEPSRLSEIETGLLAQLDNYLLRIENSLGQSEANAARNQLDQLISDWKKKIRDAETTNQELKWGTNFGSVDQFDLLKSYGQVQDENDFEAIGMMTSMRNVDTSASVKVVFK